MDVSVPSIILELLPEVGDPWGIYLQRTRIILDGKRDNQASLLGAGISLSKEVSRAKAISEALERLTLHPRTISLRKDIPIHICGTAGSPIIHVDGLASCLNTKNFVKMASACHIKREDALQAAMVEMVERVQLRHWCHQCENPDGVPVARVDLLSEEVPNVLRDFLITKPFYFVLSWCIDPTTIPFLVCLAIHHSGDFFYSASAASTSISEVVEKVLLDCAKMFLFEDYTAQRGTPILFRHSTELLPLAFREKVCSNFSTIDLRSMAEKYRQGNEALVDYYGFEHSAPWTEAMGCYVFSVLTKSEESDSTLFRCFQ